MGVRLRSTFNDDYGTRYRVDIHDADYSSSVTEFVLGGDGFTLSYDGAADDCVDPIIGSTLEFTFNETIQAHTSALDVLATAEEGRFTVEVTKDPDGSPLRFWCGVVLTEQMSRPDVPYPRSTTVTATCDLGNLKNIDFNNAGTPYTGKENLRNVLIECLKKCRTSTTHWTTSVTDAFVFIGNGIYADNAVSKDIGANQISQSLFRNPDDNGTPKYFSTYEVLRSLAVTFNARVYQAEGAFFFVPVSQYQTTPGSLSATGFRRTGAIASVSSSFTTNVNQGATFQRIEGGRETTLAPLKRVTRSMDALASTPIIASADLTPYSSTTLTDDGRTYNANQKLVVGGKFVYSWPQGHSGSVPALLFARLAALELRFTIKVGNKYLTRTATYNDNTFVHDTGSILLDYYLPTYGEDTWGTGVGYWPVVWGGFANLYNAPSISDTFTFEFTVPEDLSGLELSVDIVGRDGNGAIWNDATVGDGTTAPVIKFLNMAVYYGGDQIPNQIEFRANSNKDSRHKQDQGTVLIGDTIGDVTLGELEVNTGSSYAPATNWSVDGLEDAANNVISTTFIHRLGVDEVLRMRIEPVKVWESTWRGTAEFYFYNTVFFDSTYWLPVSYRFVAQVGAHEMTLYKVARDAVSASTVAAEADVVFNDDPRNSKGPAAKPTPLLDGDRLRDLKGEGNVNGDLSDIQADVNTNTTAIATLDGSVTSNQSSISANTTTIATHTGQINSVSSNVGDLRKNMFSDAFDKLGVFSDTSDITKTGLDLSTTNTAKLRGGPNTQISVTESSPGTVAVKVQAGATGSEAEVTAITVSGSSTDNTRATVMITGGDFRSQSPFQFSAGGAFSAGQTVTFAGDTTGIDYGDLSNQPTLVTAITGLTDVPNSLGTAGQVLAVNAGATALEFTTASGGGADNSLSETDQTITGGTTRKIILAGAGGASLANLNVEDSQGNVLESISAFGFGVVIQEKYGALAVRSTAIMQGAIVLYEAAANGVNFITLRAPAAVTANTTLILPDGAGSSGQALTTDGSGNLSWTTISGGGGSSAPCYLLNTAGRFSWSSADDGERVYMGHSAGNFNFYSWSTEPLTTLRSYSSSDAVGDTATVSAFHHVQYALQMPTTTKKIKVHYTLRLQNAPTSSTWGFSIWGGDRPANGNSNQTTVTLRDISPTITQISNSSSRVYSGTFTTAQAFADESLFFIAENRSGSLVSTTYMLGQFIFELID